MKFNKSVIGFVTSVMMITIIPCEISSAEKSNCWQTAYKEILNDFVCSENYSDLSGFSIYDMNKDCIPELIISEGTSHPSSCFVYSYCDKVIDLGEMGTYGSITYCCDLNIISQYDLSQGYEFESFSMIENEENIILDCFYNDKGASLNPTFKLNNNEVAEDEYKSALDSYNSNDWISLGRDYKFTDEDIIAAFENSWQNIYRNKLHEIKCSDNFTEQSMFDLYDIDKNGIPELFISADDNSKIDIYSVSNGSIYELNADWMENANYRDCTFYPETMQLRMVSRCVGTDDSSTYETFARLENLHLNKINCVESTWDSELQNYNYILNGNESSYDEYAAMLFDSSYIYIGRKFYFGEKIIDYAFNQSGELTKEQKKIYIQKICQLKNIVYGVGSYRDIINDAQFEICDLNYDGSPELAFSPSISYAGGACQIFTINDNEIVDCGHAGTYGNFTYNVQNNLVCTFSQRMGMRHGVYFKIQNGERVNIITYESVVEEFAQESNEAEAYYEIDNEDVTKDKYYEIVTPYEDEINSMTCGRRNILTISSTAHAIFGNNSLCSKASVVFANVNTIKLCFI